MNVFLIFALLVFTTISTFAQITSPIEVKTNDGQTVILKPDGNWEFKKVMPQPSPTTVVNPVKKNAEINSFSPNFSGHDFITLLTKLLDLRKRLVKSEFETTADYEKRAAEEKQKVIIENLTIEDTFTFVINGVQPVYNADLQKLKFFLPVEVNRTYIMDEDKKTAYDLSNVNLYNINNIFFDDLNDLKLSEKSYYKGFSTEVSLNVEEAKRIKNTARAAVIVQFEEPYALEDYLRANKQLQVRLIDVYFFDQQTGKILAKMSDSKK